MSVNDRHNSVYHNAFVEWQALDGTIFVIFFDGFFVESADSEGTVCQFFFDAIDYFLSVCENPFACFGFFSISSSQYVIDALVEIFINNDFFDDVSVSFHCFLQSLAAYGLRVVSTYQTWPLHP